jgi:hypothetical protein
MKRRTPIFLSYSRTDTDRAVALEQALQQRGLTVWRDARSIAAGERWAEAIEKGIRGARGVVVLVTAASARSEWVTYEYAFATGARIPIVVVAVRGARVAVPLERFQTVPYSEASGAAKKIDDGIQAQSRAAGQERATAPIILAKFQEVNGKLYRASPANTPSLGIDLWIEHAPRQTLSVAFEILDLGFSDRKWTVRRARRTADLREFLTDDMNSYGDIEIWARGIGSGSGNWFAKSTLYEALVRYHNGRPASAEIRRGLKQIRKN